MKGSEDMVISSDRIVPISVANQRFSDTMARVEDEGYLVLAKHGKPKYAVIKIDALEKRFDNMDEVCDYQAYLDRIIEEGIKRADAESFQESEETFIDAMIDELEDTPGTGNRSLDEVFGEN